MRTRPLPPDAASTAPAHDEPTVPPATPHPPPALGSTEAAGFHSADSARQPVDRRTQLRRCVPLDSVLAAGGLQGVITGLLAPRLLKPVYVEELERLERHAQSQREHL